MERKMLCKIDFENKQTALPVSYKLKMLVRHAVEATLDYEQYENPVEVSVTFTDNAGIRELNRKNPGVKERMLTAVLNGNIFDWPERFIGRSEQ